MSHGTLLCGSICNPVNINGSIRSRSCPKVICTRPTAWRQTPTTGYFMDFGDENIVRVDAKTGAATIFPTPTKNSRPRQTMLDDRGRLWFAEFAANKLAVFDTETKSFKEWDVPTSCTFSYDVFCDKNGESMERRHGERSRAPFRSARRSRGRVFVAAAGNIRRVFVDNSTDPVTFWAGNDHGAEIVRLEPLD